MHSLAVNRQILESCEIDTHWCCRGGIAGLEMGRCWQHQMRCSDRSRDSEGPSNAFKFRFLLGSLRLRFSTFPLLDAPKTSELHFPGHGWPYGEQAAAPTSLRMRRHISNTDHCCDVSGFSEHTPPASAPCLTPSSHTLINISILFRRSFPLAITDPCVVAITLWVIREHPGLSRNKKEEKWRKIF